MNTPKQLPNPCLDPHSSLLTLTREAVFIHGIHSPCSCCSPSQLNRPYYYEAYHTSPKQVPADIEALKPHHQAIECCVVLKKPWPQLVAMTTDFYKLGPTLNAVTQTLLFFFSLQVYHLLFTSYRLYQPAYTLCTPACCTNHNSVSVIQHHETKS